MANQGFFRKLEIRQHIMTALNKVERMYYLTEGEYERNPDDARWETTYQQWKEAYLAVKKAKEGTEGLLEGKAVLGDDKIKIEDYKAEISFEQALDELHDAAHEHKAHPSRATSKRLKEAEAQLYKARMEFAGEDIHNIRDGRKGIDANPAKWKKYWETITRGKVHKKGAIIKALKKAHAKITSPAAFARALEERFG